MNCYFCKREHNKSSEGYGCDYCQTTYNLHYVMTYDNGITAVAAIHPNKPKYIQVVPAMPSLIGPFNTSPIFLPEKKEYAVRFYLQENRMDIFVSTSDNYDIVTTLPGLSITPANVREKLKTYLVFS